MSERSKEPKQKSPESDKLFPKAMNRRIAAVAAFSLGLGLVTTNTSHNSSDSVKPTNIVEQPVDSLPIISRAELELVQSAKKAEDKINSDIAIGNQVPVLADGSAKVDFDDGHVETIIHPFLTGNTNQVAFGEFNNTNPSDLVNVLTAGIGGVSKVSLNDATGKPIVGDLRSPDNLINSAIKVNWEFVEQVKHSETGNIVLTSAIHKDDSGNGMLPDRTPIGVIARKP